jgi:hypothetical protein
MTKWFLLPGMGATSAMYDLVRRDLRFEVSFINWPDIAARNPMRKSPKEL